MIEQAAAREFWWVFYRRDDRDGDEVYILNENDMAGSRDRWKLEARGWLLLWDSAPSHEAAVEASADGRLIGEDGEPVHGFERACSLCGTFRSTELVRATVWRLRGHRENWGAFYGYMCEECRIDDDVRDVRATRVLKRRRRIRQRGTAA